jgi:hypothetical protein
VWHCLSIEMSASMLLDMKWNFHGTARLLWMLCTCMHTRHFFIYSEDHSDKHNLAWLLYYCCCKRASAPNRRYLSASLPHAVIQPLTPVKFRSIASQSLQNLRYILLHIPYFRFIRYRMFDHLPASDKVRHLLQPHITQTAAQTGIWRAETTKVFFLAAWTMHFQIMVKEKPTKCIFRTRPYI